MPLRKFAFFLLRLRLAWALVVPFSAVAVAAHAQIAAYAMGSGAFLGSGNGNAGFSAFGGTFGIYDNFVRLGPLKLGGDARYFQNTSSGNTAVGNHIRGGLVGPRLALNLPLLPFRPYIQAEIGDIATNYGTLPNRPNSFAYEIQGGRDFTLFPHLDLRGEYGGGQIKGYAGGQQQGLQEAGLGLVLRL